MHTDVVKLLMKYTDTDKCWLHLTTTYITNTPLSLSLSIVEFVQTQRNKSVPPLKAPSLASLQERRQLHCSLHW